MIDRIVVWALSLKAKLSGERGQDLMEYALLGGFIAVAFAAAATIFLGGGVFNTMAGTIKNCIDFDSSTLCKGVP
jgi:Flp pilus assembly pilin Flp